jgi:hypothetical protein
MIVDSGDKDLGSLVAGSALERSGVSTRLASLFHLHPQIEAFSVDNWNN